MFPSSQATLASRRETDPFLTATKASPTAFQPRRSPRLPSLPASLPGESTSLPDRTAALAVRPPGKPEKTGNVPPLSLLYLTASPDDRKTTTDNPPPPSAPDDIFATTHGTVVLAAGRRHTPQSDGALEELCRTYWFPLYAYVRRRGHNKEDAEDSVQRSEEHTSELQSRQYLVCRL